MKNNETVKETITFTLGNETVKKTLKRVKHKVSRMDLTTHKFLGCDKSDYTCVKCSSFPDIKWRHIINGQPSISSLLPTILRSVRI